MVLSQTFRTGCNYDMDTRKGVLTRKNGKSFLLGDDGIKYFQDDIIWDGYTRHWIGRRVYARYLAECDYLTKSPIIILWPEIDKDISVPFVELYYNERLVKYPLSVLGHIAINVNNEVFNYSHLLIENEVMTPEEYFYRPALGEFSPHPETLNYNIDDPEHPYYDRFGRLFMRTIHVLRVERIDTDTLSSYYHNILKEVHDTPVDPARPDKYSKFNVFTRSCATTIRNGLRKAGYPKISGVTPRDLFVNAVYHFVKEECRKGEVKLSFYRMQQLKVRECGSSKLTPVLNPHNWLRKRSVNYIY